MPSWGRCTIRPNRQVRGVTCLGEVLDAQPQRFDPRARSGARLIGATAELESSLISERVCRVAINDRIKN